MMMWMWISMIEILASAQQSVGAVTSRPKDGIMEPHSPASDGVYPASSRQA